MALASSGVGWSEAGPSKNAFRRSQNTNQLRQTEEDNECTICFDEAFSVTFQPCKHGACTECVNNLRRQVVFKADKGLKCPYCRQFIEGYEYVGNTGNSKAKQALKEANQAAKAAALARGPVQRQKKVTEVQAAGRDAGGWLCAKCKAHNSQRKKTCSRLGCNEVAPLHVLQQLVTAKHRQDIFKLSDKDIQMHATIKMHPSFNAALAEAGMPFDATTGILAGTEASVEKAILDGGLKQLQRIMEALLSDGFVEKLVYDFYGNYTLQDLIEATRRLRDAVDALLCSGRLIPALAYKSLGLVGRRDYLGRLAQQIGATSHNAVTHAQGNFVVEKILDRGDAGEVMDVTRGLVENPYAYISHRYAFYRFIKVVDKLGTYAFTSKAFKGQASASLDAICQSFLKDVGSLDRLLLNDLGGGMVLEAAQGGLPNPNAVQVLHRVAANTVTLKNSPAGVNALKALLRLEARDSECRELIITNVCIMAQHLEGQYAATMKAANGGPQIIRRMLELLSEEDDDICREWTNCIVADLVDQAQSLMAKPSLRNVMLYGLQLPAVAAHIPDRLKFVSAKFGHQVCLAIQSEIFPKGMPQEIRQQMGLSVDRSQQHAQQAEQESCPHNQPPAATLSSKESANSIPMAFPPGMPSLQEQLHAVPLPSSAPQHTKSPIVEVPAPEVLADLLPGLTLDPPAEECAEGCIASDDAQIDEASGPIRPSDPLKPAIEAARDETACQAKQIQPANIESAGSSHPPVKRQEPVGNAWTCTTCTFVHSGEQSEYLTCAMCCTVRPS